MGPGERERGRGIGGRGEGDRSIESVRAERAAPGWAALRMKDLERRTPPAGPPSAGWLGRT